MSADGPGLGTKVSRGVAWAGAAQAIIAVADMVSVFLVTALWVPSVDFGVIAPILPFYTALDYIADLGVSSALIQHDDHTPERVSTVFWLNLLISAGLFLALCGIGPLVAWVQHTPVLAWLLIAYGAKLLIQNLYAIPYALLRKELRFPEVAKARVVAHLAESGSRILFAYFGASYWSFTLAAITRAFVFGVVVQAWHPYVPRWVFKPRAVIPYIKFGARTAASNVLYQIYTSVDAFVVYHYFGAEAAGIYGLADQFILEPIKTIANVVIDVAYPTFAKLRADRRAVSAQLIKFTRLNVMAVLPYTVLLLLICPEILRLFVQGKGTSDLKWTPHEVELCADAIRILFVMGFFRSLGYLGPPVLDGMGRPSLTLRYMIVAAIAVPTSFLLGAKLLGPHMGFLSVAVAWAIGYPIAFAVLAYLVIHTVKLPVRDYIHALWGIVVSCGIGCGVGFGVQHFLPGVSDWIRLGAIGGSALATIAILFVYWLKLTPKTIAASLRD